MSNKNPGCLGVILQLFGLMPNVSDNEVEKLPYALRDDFLSYAEYIFYKVLFQAVDGKAVICPKVSLQDIFFVTGGDQSKRTAYLNKINRKHVDFLVCSVVNMKPICGVELDDSSHVRTDRIERDEFVDKVFKTAGLPILRFKAKRSYSVEEIKEKIEEILLNIEDQKKVEADSIAQESNNSMEIEIPICPKCGIPMVLRTVSKGERMGEQFYGCKNYPKCREVKKKND